MPKGREEKMRETVLKTIGPRSCAGTSMRALTVSALCFVLRTRMASQTSSRYLNRIARIFDERANARVLLAAHLIVDNAN